MRTGFSKHYDWHRLAVLSTALIICAGQFLIHASDPEIYDIDAAKEYCDVTPLEDPEGVWLYPDDGVTVLIARRAELSQSSLPSYEMRVVDSSDVRLHPGDVIGYLEATPERGKFGAHLFTERGKDTFLKPKSVLAVVSDEGETMIFKKDKPKFSFRFTLNPSILLPKLWKVIRLNASSGNSSTSNQTPAVGMVKIYPSYDGNGSSRRRPRYL